MTQSRNDMAKEAVSSTLVRRALRARQLRNFAARAIGSVAKNTSDGRTLTEFVAANSRTAIPRQLINAVRNKAPLSAVARDTVSDSEQIARTFGRLLNRTSAPDKASLVGRLRYALGSGPRPDAMPKINTAPGGKYWRGGAPSRLQRLRGAMLAGRGNLDLIKDTRGQVNKDRILRYMKADSSPNDLKFESATGHRLGLSSRQALSDAPAAPGVIGVPSLSHRDFPSLSVPQDAQRVRAALKDSTYAEALLAQARQSSAGYAADPTQLGVDAVKLLPPANVGAFDLAARLGTAKRTLPRSFVLETAPGHNQVRAMYQGAGFIPLQDGNMLLPGGSYTLPGFKPSKSKTFVNLRKSRYGKRLGLNHVKDIQGVDLSRLYQARRLMRTTAPDTLAGLGIDPGVATIKNLLLHPRKAIQAAKYLNVGAQRAANAASTASVAKEILDTARRPPVRSAVNSHRHNMMSLQQRIAQSQRMYGSRIEDKAIARNVKGFRDLNLDTTKLDDIIRRGAASDALFRPADSLGLVDYLATADGQRQAISYARDVQTRGKAVLAYRQQQLAGLLSALRRYTPSAQPAAA